jgi:hypothetical protein
MNCVRTVATPSIHGGILTSPPPFDKSETAGRFLQALLARSVISFQPFSEGLECGPASGEFLG